MRVSLNQIKQYIDFELPSVDELVDTINRKLGGVERVIDLEKQYGGAVIVRVDSCEKHPNADKLNICQVDDGSGSLTQVVCGAPNVRAGMYTVWLKPGSTVPSTAEDKEPFVLGARELRGVMSNGMMASPKELGLGDSHDGILEIDANQQAVSGDQIVAGMSFAGAYGLNDTLIEIENKMFTHRPDLFGQIGVAREIAGILGHDFTSPDWYATAGAGSLPTASEALPLTVFNEADDNVPRFTSIVMNSLTIAASPLWLQCELVRMGGKPINAVVDLTNYIMLVTAQPTHAYDYDKIRGATIGARMARQGETVRLLNGKSYSLNESDIVIADNEGPIGLAGIMGGGDSEVSESTTNIVLEVANFDMYTLRKSSMRHGVFTDALTRFNKGQSPYQNAVIITKLAALIHEITGATIASELHDVGDGFDRAHDGNSHLEAGTVSAEFVNTRLGTQLSSEEMESLLESVEFDVEINETSLSYNAPFWRTDIIEAEDIVEEVGRLYGFDKLPRILPRRSAKPAPYNARILLKSQLRSALASLGANEVLTYSFVNEKLLTKSGQDPKYAFRLSNALSPDLQLYRLSLMPSLLDKIALNFRAGYENFALFEMGKSHFKGEMDQGEPGVPNEDEHLAFIIAGSDPASVGYYSAKRYLASIADTTELTMLPMTEFSHEDEWGAQLIAAYDKDRTVVIVKDDQIWGVVGEFSQEVRKAFKLPAFAAGFEVHLNVVKVPQHTYSALSRYPGTSRDISVKVSSEMPYEAVASTVRESLSGLDGSFVSSFSPISIYKANDTDDKTVTLRIALVNTTRTMKDDEVSSIVRTVTEACTNKLQATIV